MTTKHVSRYCWIFCLVGQKSPWLRAIAVDLCGLSLILNCLPLFLSTSIHYTESIWHSTLRPMHNGCYFLWISRQHTVWIGTKYYSSSPCIVSTYLVRGWYIEISITFPPWLNNEWSLQRQHLNNFQFCISSIKHNEGHVGILNGCFRDEPVNEWIEGWIERDSLTFVQPGSLTCALP